MLRPQRFYDESLQANNDNGSVKIVQNSVTFFWTIFFTSQVNFTYFESNWCTSFSNQKAESKWWLSENEKKYQFNVEIAFHLFFLQIKNYKLFSRGKIPPCNRVCGLNYFAQEEKKIFLEKKTFTSFWSCKFVQKLLFFCRFFFKKFLFLTRKSEQKWPSYFMMVKQHSYLRKALS